MSQTAYDLCKQLPRYQLPHEAAALRREWWTTAQAARAWGVSPRTARRIFDQLDEVTSVLVMNVRTGRSRVLRCVRPGTLRPPVRRGNPRFADPEWQRANSARRWDGHITAEERKQLYADEKAAAFARVVRLASRYLRG